MKYPCPICNRRACDSFKPLHLTRLSQSNEKSADVIIKCNNCKTTLAVNVTKGTLVTEELYRFKEVIY
jgi:hypothetical protein